MAWFKNVADIKVGVVGYGGAFNMGKHHLNEMKLAGMSPFAVCEVDPKRLEVAKTDFPGIETYGSLDELLKKSAVTLIVHITPHNLHFPLALKCLQAGKHVVTEKPFVINTAECDKLIAVAKKKNLVVSTYHNRHWDGWILRAMDQVVKKKEIGDIYRIEVHMGGYGMPGDWWRTSKSISGGILYDWGCHQLEYCLQLMGKAKVTEVTGFAVKGFWAEQMPAKAPWKKDCNEDDASAIIRFDNGVMVNLNITQLSTVERKGMMEILGTKGSYTIEWGNWTTRKPIGRKNEQGKPILVTESGPHYDSQSPKFYANVAQHLIGKEELIITPQWARRPIHILDLANQSAKLGKSLKAKYG